MDVGIRKMNVFNGSVEYELAKTVNSWTLMGSPLLLIAITLFYLAFVTKLGPDYMKKRQPYSLKYTLIVYNVVQVAYSVFLVYAGGKILYRHGVLHKQCIIKTNLDEAGTVVTMFYYYLLAKISELLDTVFFVLRKKQNQISFLHVYHHTFVVVLSWLEIQYERNENYAFIGTLNSFVHVIMYTYYGLSAIPAMRKYLWWKRYITSIQLIQFLIAMCHLIISQVISECPISVISGSVIIGNLILFYYLFTSFYNNNYVKPKNEDSESNDEYSNGEVNQGKTSRSQIYSNGSLNGYSNGIKNRNHNNGTQNENGNIKLLNGVDSHEILNGKLSNELDNVKHINGKQNVNVSNGKSNRNYCNGIVDVSYRNGATNGHIAGNKKT